MDILVRAHGSFYDNSISALKPEWWANESLAVLEENLVIAGLVNRDYNNAFQAAGDTVHVNKPGTFAVNHKVKGSTTTVQDANATDTTVKLNQHLEVTILLDDREVQQSLPDLRQYFLVPQMRAMYEGVDAIVAGEAFNFYLNVAGTPGLALTDDALINLGKVFDDNNNPAEGRNLVVGSAGKADLLRIDRFIDADKTGERSRLIQGQIGTVMGFNTYMSQALRYHTNTVPSATEVVNGAQAKGITALTVDSAAAHITGTWFKVAGVEGMYRVASTVTSTDTTINFTPALKGDVADNAVLTFYDQAGDVKGAHAAGVVKIITDGYAAADDVPSVGMGVSFGSATDLYTVTRVEGTWASSSTEITLTLNRPLDVALSDDATIHSTPGSSCANFAFRKDAITLVNRPLAPAASGSGVASAVQNNGLYSVRVTMGYDMAYMRHKITIDTLFGVKTLDLAQGAILFN